MFTGIVQGVATVKAVETASDTVEQIIAKQSS
jgi:hypothetical protein